MCVAVGAMDMKFLFVSTLFIILIGESVCQEKPSYCTTSSKGVAEGVSGYTQTGSINSGQPNAGFVIQYPQNCNPVKTSVTACDFKKYPEVTIQLPSPIYNDYVAIQRQEPPYYGEAQVTWNIYCEQRGDYSGMNISVGLLAIADGATVHAHSAVIKSGQPQASFALEFPQDCKPVKVAVSACDFEKYPEIIIQLPSVNNNDDISIQRHPPPFLNDAPYNWTIYCE